MKTTKIRRPGGEKKLLGILEDLFGDVSSLTEDEFNLHLQVLGEQECWLIHDGFLTEDEILRIEEGWTPGQKIA